MCANISNKKLIWVYIYIFFFNSKLKRKKNKLVKVEKKLLSLVSSLQFIIIHTNNELGISEKSFDKILLHLGSII